MACTPSPAQQRGAASSPGLLLALLLALLVAQQPRSCSAQPASDNGCAAILRSAVYRVFYLAGDAGPYAAFERSVCSLPSTAQNELELPLTQETQAAFDAAAVVLVRGWRPQPTTPPDFSSSSPYKVVRDYHTATCKVS